MRGAGNRDQRNVHAVSRPVAPDRKGAVRQGEGSTRDLGASRSTPAPAEAHGAEGGVESRLGDVSAGTKRWTPSLIVSEGLHTITALNRSCSARCHHRPRRSSTASIGSSGSSVHSAARTSLRPWSCVGGDDTLHLCTRSGRRCPGQFMPDLNGAGCILFWGYNPAVSRLAHATATREALRRGAKLVVVDPRQAGFAAQADPWLRVRPGTDAALALAITNVMIEHGWYDEHFVRRWTSGPLQVRADTGRFLRASDLAPGGDEGHYVAWDAASEQPVVLDPAARGADTDDHDRLMQFGTVGVATTDVPVTCRPVFDMVAEQCRATSPAIAERITGVRVADIERAAQVLWEHRPVAFYTWSGLEQHSGTTQIIRAINVLYALTGCLDDPGGNVLFTPVPSNAVAGAELLDPAQWAKAIGVGERAARPSPLRVRHRRGLLQRCARRKPVPSARVGELRVQSRDGAWRQRSRSGGVGGARLPRASGPLHEPDRRAGRHRAPGFSCLRGRGAQDRIRGLPGRPLARAAATSTGQPSR